MNECSSPGVISTHSLTKRLTLKGRIHSHLFYISTHSLTKRLTGMETLHEIRKKFQLTASRRGWRQFRTKIPSPKLHFCNYYIYCFLCSSFIRFFVYFFFLNLSFCRCECSRESCVLNFRTYNIKVSVTSKPGLAPICSTLFLYFSPK